MLIFLHFSGLTTTCASASYRVFEKRPQRNFIFMRHTFLVVTVKMVKICVLTKAIAELIPCYHFLQHLVYSRFPRLLEGPGFFLQNSRTWKVLENHFGPGKSWKLNFKVIDSPGKIFNIVATRCHILRLKCTKFHFSWGSQRSSRPPSWM